MKITKHDIAVELREDMVRAEEDYGVLTTVELADQISKIYNRQVKSLYIVEDGNCAPALLVQWLFYLGEEDECDVLPITCSVRETAFLRRMGVL